MTSGKNIVHIPVCIVEGTVGYSAGYSDQLEYPAEWSKSKFAVCGRESNTSDVNKFHGAGRISLLTILVGRLDISSVAFRLINFIKFLSNFATGGWLWTSVGALTRFSPSRSVTIATLHTLFVHLQRWPSIMIRSFLNRCSSIIFNSLPLALIIDNIMNWMFKSRASTYTWHVLVDSSGLQTRFTNWVLGRFLIFQFLFNLNRWKKGWWTHVFRN